MRCPHCGHEREPGATRCPGCGDYPGRGEKSSAVSRRVPVGLQVDQFQHPEDRAALGRLRTLGPVVALTRAVMRHLAEPALRARLLGSGVRTGPGQFGDIHRIVAESAAVLRLEPPDCFVVADPRFNAATYGTVQPFIVLHSSLVDAFTADELYFVIGHELGHLKCEHVLYLNAAEFVARGAAAYLGHVVLVAARGALDAWMRKAEFSADRAGLLCVQDLEAASRALLKLVLGSTELLARVDLEAYLAQAEELDRGWGRMAELFENHPFAANRLRELRRFALRGAYDGLLGAGRAAVLGGPPVGGEDAEGLAGEALERGLSLLKDRGALFATDRGPRRRALDEFSLVLTTFPGTAAAVEALFHSAAVYLLERNPAEALRRFAEFVDRYPDHRRAPEALFLLGHIHERHLGRREAALEAYEQVIRRYPDSPQAGEAREALAR
ncbi:MAG: M48 family metalloprotease [bacterium]|nr:M48 family metalloprotease [bacterium]